MHRQAADPGLVHCGTQLGIGPQIELVDEHIVDTGGREARDLGACVGLAGHRQLPGPGARAHGLAQHGSGDEQRRAGNSPLVDTVANPDGRVERRTGITRAGDSGRKQLRGGQRHAHPLRDRQVVVGPALLVGVAQPRQVRLQVPQAGQDCHTLRGNDLGILRDGKLTDSADGGDLLALDDNHAVAQGRIAVAIDHGTAGKHQRPRLGGGRQGQQRGDRRQQQPQPAVPCIHGPHAWIDHSQHASLTPLVDD